MMLDDHDTADSATGPPGRMNGLGLVWRARSVRVDALEQWLPGSGDFYAACPPEREAASVVEVAAQAGLPRAAAVVLAGELARAEVVGYRPVPAPSAPEVTRVLAPAPTGGVMPVVEVLCIGGGAVQALSRSTAPRWCLEDFTPPTSGRTPARATRTAVGRLDLPGGRVVLVDAPPVYRPDYWDSQARDAAGAVAWVARPGAWQACVPALEQATVRGLACVAAVPGCAEVPDIPGVRVLARPSGRAEADSARSVVAAVLEQALARAARGGALSANTRLQEVDQ